MTVGELIKVLSEMNPNLEVQVGVVATQRFHKVSGAHVVVTKGVVAVCAIGKGEVTT